MVISAYCETLHAHGVKFWINVLGISLSIHILVLYLLLDDFNLDREVYQLPGKMEIVLQTRLAVQPSQPQPAEEQQRKKVLPSSQPVVSKPVVPVRAVSTSVPGKSKEQLIKKETMLKGKTVSKIKSDMPQTRQTAYLKPQVVSNLDNVKPFYPIAARRRGMEGEVLLNVVIGLQGEVMNIKVKKSSGYRILDDAALQTVRDWKFLPARKGKETVLGNLDIPIKFKLLNN